MEDTKVQKKQRVVVAMSGGVDSSVAAFLLHQQGYEVIGISLKVWDEEAESRRTKTCCSIEDITDARRVCNRLGVPFYAFNYKKTFEEKVINRFVDEYKQGRTPNPCILCNNHVKFDRLLEEADKLGADFLATGHHARLLRDENGQAHLIKGVDTHKDQSYVLFDLGQDRLRRILLPVGDYTKDEIRKIADDNNVPTAFKRESQDICFIPGGDYAKFIRERLGPGEDKIGNFVDLQGQVLGQHEGIYKYTVGQRRGLGIGFGERLYVVRIDPQRSEVVLGTREDLTAQGLRANNVKWLQPMEEGDIECCVKVRYQKDDIPALVSRDNDEVRVLFKGPAPAISPGQAAVFYRGDEVLGGGWIQSPQRIGEV